MARVNGFVRNDPTGRLLRQEPTVQLPPGGRASLVATPTPRVNGFVQSAAPALSGFQAGQSVPAGTDLASSLAGVGTATAGGALSGALSGAAIGAAGGPIGALGGAAIGGGAALLTSSLNAWLATRTENKRKRETEKFIKELETKNARREAQDRKDRLMQIQFNRSDIERNQVINAFNAKRQQIMDAINNNQTLKDRFIQTGVR